MPLGLAKDSMLNLAELASSKIEEEEYDNSSHQIPEDGEGSPSAKTIIDLQYREEDKQIASPTSIEGSKLETDSNDTGVETVAVAVAAATAAATTIISNTSSKLDNRASQITAEKSQVQQYAGFSADYHDFENYAFHSSYSFDGESSKSTPLIGKNNNNGTSWWKCIFPWCIPGDDSGEGMLEDDSPGGEEQKRNGEAQSPKIDFSDDEISMVSAGSDNVLGEKLSERDHQAVLARLRLAQPDATNPQQAKSDDEKEERKSILKRNSTRNQDNLNQSTRSNLSNGSHTSQSQKRQSQRRSLFPCYEEKTVVKKNLNVNFSPMARVVTIKSSKEMDDAEKSSIWWQKPDYDEFRKTGRIISKVMLQGGSEIWLATNQSWQLPNQGKAATLRRAMANVDREETRDKWWHKFGHSRRGLEHIASIDEGRQRQGNVKTSIRAILTEQRRQKAFHREDPDKLRSVSIQNTSWAKDLAFASGASDADAVSKNFDDGSRRSREFYLLKFSHANQRTDHNTSTSIIKQVVPAFMKPMVTMKLRPNRLDANTTSRIEFRQNEGKAANHQRISSDLLTRPSNREHIHDAAFDGPVKESLARKGKSFLLSYP
jgi:hypothetical protein